MKYKVYETVMCVGHNNNKEIKNTFVMNELQAEVLKQRLEADEYISDNRRRYIKSVGVDVFRDDQVKEAVQKEIYGIARQYNMDTNTKEWEDVRKALEIALTQSDYENLKDYGSSSFHDFEGDTIQYVFEEIEDSHIFRLIEKDWCLGEEWDEWYTVELNDNEVHEIMELKPQTLYNHLKQRIGVQTSSSGNVSYFAPKFRIAKFAISIQLNYYLWRLRERFGIKTSHNRPMTEGEFDIIVPSLDSCLDVKFFTVDEDGKLEDFGRPDQMSLNQVCDFLYTLVQEGEIVID